MQSFPLSLSLPMIIGMHVLASRLKLRQPHWARAVPSREAAQRA